MKKAVKKKRKRNSNKTRELKGFALRRIGSRHKKKLGINEFMYNFEVL